MNHQLNGDPGALNVNDLEQSAEKGHEACVAGVDVVGPYGARLWMPWPWPYDGSFKVVSNEGTKTSCIMSGGAMRMPCCSRLVCHGRNSISAVSDTI